MDVLNFVESQTNLEGTVTNKTGLETTPTETKQDTSWWSTTSTLLSKGLDLGLAITNPQAKQEPIVAEPKKEKIMGISKPIFYGGVALLGLIGAVIVVKKMKK